MNKQPIRVAVSLALSSLPACQPQQPAAAPATACPVVSMAPATPVPTATPTPAGAAFRDDFDETNLDGSRWLSFPQSGLVRIQDGKLDSLNTGGQKNFPYLVTRDAIIPATGPFYFELAYQFISNGGQVSFSLDYLPAEAPNEKPLTTPFMVTSGFYDKLRMVFDTETTPQTIDGTKGIAAGPHVLRIENDGNNTYRVVLDGAEAGTFTSKRRPTKFWMGQNPPKDLANGATWPRIELDYVAAGPLDAPAPASDAGASTAATPTP